MDRSVDRQAIRCKAGAKTTEDVPLVVEEPLEIRVNGEPLAVLMRTPGDELELAAGFCLTEGVVDSYSEITLLDICKAAGENYGNVVNVFVDKDNGATARLPRALTTGSSCGLCGARMLDEIKRDLTPLAPGPVFPLSEVIALQYAMFERQELFRRTWGGTHAVALARAGAGLIVVREDIGRHNAMDKVIGHAMREGLDMRECIAILSGRISFEMVQKAVRAKIPVVAAVSAATAMAVELA